MAGISKRDEWMDEPTDKQRQTNMPHQLFQSWGHKNEGFTTVIRCKRYYIPYWMPGAPTPQSQFHTYPLPISPAPFYPSTSPPLVLSTYIFLTFANLKMLYRKWLLFGVRLYIRFSSFLSPKHVKTTLIVNYHYIMLLALTYLARNSSLCIHVDCLWERNYISTCAFVLIPICIMTSSCCNDSYVTIKYV